MKKKILLTLLFCIGFKVAWTQEGCENFDMLLKKGDASFHTKQPNFKTAIDDYTAAWLVCPERSKEARSKINEVFRTIEQLKDKAIAAEKQAKAEKDKSEKQKNAVIDLLKGFLPVGVTDIYAFYATRADSLFAIGNYTGALSDYKASEILKTDSKNEKLLQRKALCEELPKIITKANKYLFDNLLQEAELSYKKVLNDNPTDLHCQLKLKAISQINENNIIFVQGGSFLMGSSTDSSSTEYLHKVTLSNFYISRTEVTNTQYARFLNEYQNDEIKTGNKFAGARMIYPSVIGVQFIENQQGFENQVGVVGLWQPAEGYENYPVVYITWFGAYEFCRWYGYCLPTEAQWEYAARGGHYQNLSNFIYAGSNNIDSVAWYKGNTDKKTHAVGTKAPNKLGLYDMSGNVWEWCLDWYKSDFYVDCSLNNNLVENPVYNPESNTDRVLRGGSWSVDESSCTNTYREYGATENYWYNFGFRFALCIFK